MGWVEMQLARRELEVKGKPIHLNTFGTKIVAHLFSLRVCIAMQMVLWSHCKLQFAAGTGLQTKSRQWLNCVWHVSDLK